MSDKRQPLLIVEDDPALQKQMQWAFDSYEIGARAAIARPRSRSCAASSRPW